MAQGTAGDQEDSHQAAASHTYNSTHHSGTAPENNIASDLETLRLGFASSTGTLDESLGRLEPSADSEILANSSNTQLAAEALNKFQTGSSGSPFGSESPSELLGDECRAWERDEPGDAEGAPKTPQSAEPELSPDSFNSLAEAFRSSLHVVRCLRTAVRLLQGTERCDVRTWGTQGNQNGDEQQGLPPDAAFTAAKLIASQEAFVAEEAAYARLLGEAANGRPVPDAGASAPPGEKSAAEATDTHEAAAAVTCLVDEGFLKDPAPLTGDLLPVGKRSTEHLTATSAGSINAPSALEYELSVCKALLLLQQLTPSCPTTIEEVLTPSCPPLVPSLLIDRPRTVLEKRARTESLPHKNDTASKLLLDALLRVRLLQGTQQLLRADFLKLLHEQRRQHQQLQQAVQATVTKLEAERDTLLGRMQKLSAVVNRK
ncbi:hypothetical protein Esti_001771 [Eimeria stiedai]